MKSVPEAWQWYNDARFGLFLHWGPYSQYGRGEQVINREWLDQKEYARTACRWNPEHYDPAVWAAIARRAGMRYAVLTTTHHDGYCLWDTATTDYSSAAQAPRRDFVAEYVEAFRAAGLRVGLYHSLIDFRLPAWFDGPTKDPKAWQAVCDYKFEQVRELLTAYGKIDVLWFDGIWPHRGLGDDFDSQAMMRMIRELQPDIMVNDRLEWPQFSYYWQFENWRDRYKGKLLGDFGTPELGIYTDPDFLWESCQTATTRLWGYARGEAWRSPAELLTLLVDCARQGGNLLLNVGPQPDGRIPPQFIERTEAIGAWLEIHGEAIYGSDSGMVTEFITYGRQILHGNRLYLIFLNWPETPELRLVGLKTQARRATLLTTGQSLTIDQNDDRLVLSPLPPQRPCPLFPAIRLDFDSPPEPNEWGATRTWQRPDLFARWARTRGTSVWADGIER